MKTKPVLLDHTIVAQSLTSLTIRKDREFAGCRICGAVFQSSLAVRCSDEEWSRRPLIYAEVVHEETDRWRAQHNKTHTQREHEAFTASGRTLSPEAAHKMAPFGLVPVLDVIGIHPDEINGAMLEAPRAPYDDVQSSLKGYVTKKGR